MEMLLVAAEVVRPAMKTTNTRFQDSVFRFRGFFYLGNNKQSNKIRRNPSCDPDHKPWSYENRVYYNLLTLKLCYTLCRLLAYFYE
jgi:hypothetical protein